MLLCTDWSLSFQVIVKWQVIARSYFERKNKIYVEKFTSNVWKLMKKCTFLLKNWPFQAQNLKMFPISGDKARQILTLFIILRVIYGVRNPFCQKCSLYREVHCIKQYI